MCNRSKVHRGKGLWSCATSKGCKVMYKARHIGAWQAPEQLPHRANAYRLQWLASVMHAKHLERVEMEQMQEEAQRETDSMMLELRHFLESLGTWMPTTLIDGIVAASRARRLTAIAKDGLQEVRWRESISKAVHDRINAMMFSAGGQRNPAIAQYLAYETDAPVEVAVAQLSLCVSEVPAGISASRN
jgi:hypothetical protein